MPLYRNKPSDYLTPRFLVAAVGASAGGLEAFISLLRGIPADAQLSLVLSQHIPRDHASMLPEVLARRTPLKVVAAGDAVLIKVGHVYVIEPDTHVTVIDGHLRVLPRPLGPANLSADALFSSIAKYYGNKAVGVVLSGALSDGSQGMRDIRAAGGMTFAQQPGEAQFQSMPAAAIATGDVDVILAAQEIGLELVRRSALQIFEQPVG